MISVPLRDFIVGIHDVGARDKRDAAHVIILAREVREMLVNAPTDDPDVKSLLESCAAAERMAWRFYSQRPINLTTLNNAIQPAGAVAAPAIPAGATTVAS